MSDRGAPQFAGVLALLAIVFVVVYWVTPSGEVRVPPEVEQPSDSAPTAESDAAGVEIPEPVEPRPESTTESDPVPGLGGNDVLSFGSPPESAIDDEEGADAGDALAVEPPVFREFTIRPPGMTLEEVSLEVYGTRRHWRAIARMNGHSLDPNRVRPNQVIKVPRDPENVQGLADEDAGELPEPEPAYTEYIVSRNDTLWDIAKALYGSGTKWTVIRDANRELVGSDGSRLRSGMVLRIPPPTGD